MPLSSHERSPEQRAWHNAAIANVDGAALGDLVAEMVAIPSPTGRERTLAEYVVRRLAGAGFAAEYQAIDASCGNATARYRGDGTGANLLLYAPIDTHIDDASVEDARWIGGPDRPDQRSSVERTQRYVLGLGAENPKGYAACVIAAAEAVRRTGVPLRGDLLVGLGAAGMPAGPAGHGHGRGCAHMLEHGFRGAFAVIAKPGWSVAYEEVGLSWFRIDVKGSAGYVGIRHRVPAPNAIVDAAKVITGLETWFPEYAHHNRSGLCFPQGQVGAVDGGWPDRPAFAPAVCHVYVDLRTTPRMTSEDAHRQLDAALDRIRAQHPGLDVASTLLVAVPGGATDANNWIVRSSVAAWEAVTGQTHEFASMTSGATDANILRLHGIPTARIGMPKAREPLPHDGTFSMGVVDIEAMVQLTRVLIGIAIDTCTRPRAETL